MNAVLEWLFPEPEYLWKQEALRSKRADNSGQWFLEKKEFKDWVAGSTPKLLFCPGIGICL